MGRALVRTPEDCESCAPHVTAPSGVKLPTVTFGEEWRKPAWKGSQRTAEQMREKSPLGHGARIHTHSMDPEVRSTPQHSQEPIHSFLLGLYCSDLQFCTWQPRAVSFTARCEGLHGLPFQLGAKTQVLFQASKVFCALASISPLPCSPTPARPKVLLLTVPRHPGHALRVLVPPPGTHPQYQRALYPPS